MHSNRRIFIAGNGPSLRELDFDALRDMDWLGMNAAYRYWDKVGIYPTIYSCLDKVVIKSHAQQILRLYREQRIRTFFLVKDILEEIPDFPQDDRIFFLEDVVKMKDQAADVFKTAFPDKKTTGSWAVRFAIFRGYRELYLGGIDCSYVEIVTGAKRTGTGLELQIDSKVDDNPNYFFNDYQKPGDTYQVPNPQRHFGNLHLQSFEALSVDVAKLGLDVTIRNTARGSQLHRYGVFEYAPLAEALAQPLLQALAIPTIAGEVDVLIRNWTLWDSPAFIPLRLDSPLIGKISMHVFFDCAQDNDLIAKLTEAWNQTNRLKSIFRHLKISFLSIPTELNTYIRDPNQTDAPRKMGPNLHFLAMMHLCRGYRYVQLLETDCVPAKSDWLTDLNTICSQMGPFWIAGGYLDRIGAVDVRYALHLNGNGIYATGDPEFVEFLAGTFAPALRYFILEKQEFSLAYDCLISRLLTFAITSLGRGAAKNADPVLVGYYNVVQANLDRFRALRCFCNVSHTDDAFSTEELLAKLDQDFILIHSKRLAGVVGEENLAMRTHVVRDTSYTTLQRRLKETFIKVDSAEILAVHYYTNLPEIDCELFDRTLGEIRISSQPPAFSNKNEEMGAYVIFDVNGKSAGHTIICTLRLHSDSSQRLLLRFARNGGGRFVEDRTEIECNAGRPVEAFLRLRCQQDYKQLRLQVKPLAGSRGRVSVKFGVKRDCETRSILPVIVHDDRGNDLDRLYAAFRYSIDRHSGLAKPLLKSCAVDRVTAPHMNVSHPRLLMIAGTPVGHNSATGRLKETLIAGWPSDAFLQLWHHDGTDQALHAFRLGDDVVESRSRQLDISQAVKIADDFAPDAVYVNPVASMLQLEFVETLLKRKSVPIVVHMMDDWPERLRLADPAGFANLDPLLRRVIRRATTCLSICDSMSRAYGNRYGREWLPLANGVDISRFPAQTPRCNFSKEAPFVVRYMGALADDMTFASVSDIAHAVASLQSRHPLRFEIHTMEWCRAKAERAFSDLPGVVVHGLVESQDYERTLCQADALVIAYNFDETSVRYTRYSLANKMPECLASGTPIIAYGPEEVATIAYLRQSSLAEVVCEREPTRLRDAILRFVNDSGYCEAMGKKARQFAASQLTSAAAQQRFLEILMESTVSSQPPQLMGPFAREDKAHYDETDCIATLFGGTLAGSTMIDVGAHFGTSLAHFLDKGWQIFAFEPDRKNRSKLLERLDKHANKGLVTLDTRAVGNRSKKGLSFYTSEVSTGISSLSAFHASHHESQQVDVVTLREFLEPHDLAEVDFLKIDTEGHDLFVLQGFPWERFRPRVIECEFEDGKTTQLGYTFHDLADYLQEKGYSVYVSEWHPIVRYGIRHDWRQLTRYPCALADPRGWGNLLAFREPIDEPSLVEAVKAVLRLGAASSRGPSKGIVAGPSSKPGASGIASHPRYKLYPGRCFAPLGEPGRWRYSQPLVEAAPPWMAIFHNVGATAGRTFAAGMRIMSNKNMSVRVSLARNGDSIYEGASKTIWLVAGAPQEVNLHKFFNAEHHSLRLQLDVIDGPDGNSADMTLDSMYLLETPRSVRSRLHSKDVNLAAANRMFRDGEFSGALAIYLQLHTERHLSMYARNAEMAAQKLGLNALDALHELS